MRRFILCLTVIWSLCFSVAATEPQVEAEIRDDLPDSAKPFMEQIDLGNDFTDGIAQLLESAAQMTGGYVKATLVQVGQMISVVLVCALISAIDAERMKKTIELAGVLAIAVVGISVTRHLADAGTDALKQLCSYSDTLLPGIAMATAATGQISSASALYVGTVCFVSLLENLILKLLQPMVYIYLALACAGCTAEHTSLERLRELTGWLISTSLKVLLFIFTAYLTVTGAVSGSADATSVKAAKMTLSSVVPVVGSMLSDASETLLVSASILRNSIGVFGMLAVLAICIVPFLQTGIRYLLLKLTAAAAALFDNGAISRVIAAMSAAAGYMLAMTGTCALMLIISFVCYIRVVV